MFKLDVNNDPIITFLNHEQSNNLYKSLFEIGYEKSLILFLNGYQKKFFFYSDSYKKIIETYFTNEIINESNTFFFENSIYLGLSDIETNSFKICVINLNMVIGTPNTVSKINHEIFFEIKNTSNANKSIFITKEFIFLIGGNQNKNENLKNLKIDYNKNITFIPENKIPLIKPYIIQQNNFLFCFNSIIIEKMCIYGEFINLINETNWNSFSIQINQSEDYEYNKDVRFLGVYNEILYFFLKKQSENKIENEFDLFKLDLNPESFVLFNNNMSETLNIFFAEYTQNIMKSNGYNFSEFYPMVRSEINQNDCFICFPNSNVMKIK